MSDGNEERYQRFLDAYCASLKLGDRASAEAVFDDGARLWEEIARTESQKNPYAADVGHMHLVLTFSHAAGMGDAAEALRIYLLMGERERRAIDDAGFLSEALRRGELNK